MKWSSLFIAIIVLSFYGCADVNSNQMAIDELRLQVKDLKSAAEKTSLKIKELEAASDRVDELNKKQTLLKKRMELNTENIDELKSSAFEIQPPTGLKVVKLKDTPVAEDRPRVNITKIKKTPVRIRPKSTPRKPTVKKRSTKTASATNADNRAVEVLYQKGLDLHYAGENSKARDIFDILLSRYPKSALSDNALYWNGETYYDEEKYTEAIKKFTLVVKRYPRGNKTPDALLKAGFSYIELKKPENAKKIFEKLIKLYPDSEAALRAKERLKTL